MRFREGPTENSMLTKCKSDFLLKITNFCCDSVYKDLSESYDGFEKWLGSFIAAIDTDIMPGS